MTALVSEIMDIPLYYPSYNRRGNYTYKTPLLEYVIHMPQLTVQATIKNNHTQPDLRVHLLGTGMCCSTFLRRKLLFHVSWFIW
jgi:hypothetical protein